MENHRRALYHSLRMNWILDPKLVVEPWQVTDYRSMPLDSLFEQLEKYDIYLDKGSFLIFAESVDSPENLTDALISDVSPEVAIQDHIYLLIFELWRRLLPERPCLSIFCDEIDYQIHLYDRGLLSKPESIQDALANLQVLLDENCDTGSDPLEIFEHVDTACAHDLEGFLLDYIADQIDNRNFAYATELLDDFSEYIYHVKWFDLLRARILSATDPKEANAIVIDLLKRNDVDLEFILEVLSFLIPHGEETIFKRLVKQALALIQNEDDFQTLIVICIDFYTRLDKDDVTKGLQHILDKRHHLDLKLKFNKSDPQSIEFNNLIKT